QGRASTSRVGRAILPALSGQRLVTGVGVRGRRFGRWLLYFAAVRSRPGPAGLAGLAGTTSVVAPRRGVFAGRSQTRGNDAPAGYVPSSFPSTAAHRGLGTGGSLASTTRYGVIF